MIKDQDIICVGLPNWEGDYMKTIVEMMSVLARKNRVLYVDYEYTYKDLFSAFLKKTNIPLKRMIGLKNRLRLLTLKDNTEIHVLTPPPTLPVNWIKSEKRYRSLQNRNAQRVKDAILKATHHLGFKNPIVINAFNPFYGLPMLGKLEEKLNVYYCYDEISAAHWCKNHGAGLEIEFMQKVDLVLTSSEGLYAKKRKWNDNTYLVKNGVNFDLFHKAFQTRKVATVQKNIGYIGSMDDRLDYELLEYCIRQTPEYQYVFVGRVNDEAGRQKLAAYPNVQIIGAKSPAELPEYLKVFSLGLIPFLKNEFTENIYPLKVNEYLAAGIPVVATDFAPMDDFEEVISIADSPEAFLQSIHWELEQDNDDKARERVRIAQSNAWESRAEQFSGILLKHLVQKNASKPILV